ncbi:hypothetical protein ID866_4379 [Astraeus odoratus]|nr:hypothetical protein ID866_4379 [Astraeus odoratus]
MEMLRMMCTIAQELWQVNNLKEEEMGKGKGKAKAQEEEPSWRRTGMEMMTWRWAEQGLCL